MLDILHKMEQTARETLPMHNVGDAPHKSIPRWNEDIKPYRKDALFMALGVAFSRKTTAYSNTSSEEDQSRLSFTHSEKQENASQDEED